MKVLDDWLLTPHRLAVHVPTATAVVADLHLGYGRVRRRMGEAVPIPSVREELAPLALGLREQGVRKLVIAGDLFEDARGEAGELIEDLLAWLREEDVELTGLVPGNHDRGVGDEEKLRICKGGITLGRWRVVHGDGERPDCPVVQGHEHPWLRWRDGVGGPCYLVNRDHLVLPAYSRDAAGVNVRGQSRWASHRGCVIAGDVLLDFGEVGRLERRRG